MKRVKITEDNFVWHVLTESNGTILTVEKNMIQPAPEAKAEEKK